MSLKFCVRMCLQGSVLPAHRAVLVARCDVMAAMFSGKYAEARSRVVPIHGVSSDTFLSFLEYLYTDSCCPGEFTANKHTQVYHCDHDLRLKTKWLQKLQAQPKYSQKMSLPSSLSCGLIKLCSRFVWWCD